MSHGESTSSRNPVGDSMAMVVTVSDRSSAGRRPDESGPLLAGLVSGLGFVVDGPVVVPDDEPAISDALGRAVARHYDLVVTTGGTGIAPRDVTPEATRRVIEREVPGLAELIRAKGGESVATAWLSRGIAGTAGSTLIVNLAGSPGAVRDGMAVLGPLIGHAVSQLRGGNH